MLLALTDFGGLIALPSILACFVLMVYMLAAPLPPPQRRARTAISKVFLLTTLTFAAVWFWMSVAVPLIAWLFIFGDRHHWIYDYYVQVAGLIALAVACSAFLRATLGWVSQRYIRALAWGPPILLVAAGAFAAENSLNMVQGLTAEGAARRLMESVPRTDAAMELQPHDGPPMHPDTPSDHRAFWIVDGGEKVGLIVVRPNRLLGWQHARTHRFSDSTDILIDAQVYLNLGEREEARYCLEQVIRNLPGTTAESEARRLLATLGERPR